jgi:predicted permease
MLMGSLRQDVRHALRIFGRSPGFAAVMVAILALGIGANTAIFSILDALVLRDLPVWQPQRLVELAGIYRNGSKVPFSFPMFDELTRGQRVFSTLFGWTGGEVSNVEFNGKLFLAGVRAVTGNYYSGLGATPLLGRLIAPEDARGSASSQVAVIGYEFWQNHFGRDPGAIGKTIRIEGQPFTIVGVTRKWFTGMTPGEPAEVTIPMKSSSNRALLLVFATGRLNDGVSIQEARAQLQSFWPEALTATVPTEIPGRRRQSWLSMGLDEESAATGVNADLRAQLERPLDVLMAMVAFILLIACVNLANLTLARAAARGHEMSVRMALGARRLQIVRQLITESILLSAVGAAVALALAYWLSQFLIHLMTTSSLLPVVLDSRPDWRVFFFTAAVSLVAAVLIGLAPAWKLSRAEPAAILRSNERSLGRGAGNWGRGLVVTQIALSLVLLQGAGLLLRTFEKLRSSNPGFQRAGVIEVSLYPRPGGYRKLDMNSYQRQLIERIAGLPGVDSVAFSNLSVPAGAGGFMGWRDTVSLTAADSSPSRKALTTLVVVSPGFFRTLGIPLLTGRDFTWIDNEHHPRVAIADGNLARALLASGRVVGDRVRFGVQPAFQDLQIIGVARSARLIDLRNAKAPVLYVPCLQYPGYGQYGNLIVRASHPAAFTKAVENAIESAGHEYATGAKTIKQMSDTALHEERVTAMLSTLFSGVALLLAGTGLFGLMSYTVTRRTREIGIRMALGAQRGSILRMILGETVLLTLAGISIGLPCALAASRLIVHLLFGVSPDDPATLAVVSITLLAVGIVAGYWPAHRAVKVDPIVALRYE